MNSPVSFLTNLRNDYLQRNKMFTLNKIINVLKHLNHVSVVFEKNLLMLIYSKLQEKNCDYILIIYMKKYEKAYNNSLHRINPLLH